MIDRTPPVAPTGPHPSFGVLMAVYGKDDPALFTAAVRSVFGNSITPDEFVLVVDGPIPEALDECVIRLQAEFSLLVIRQDENRGLALALNRGLQSLRSDWVMRADADDINLPGRFSAQMEIIAADPSLALVGGGILEVDDDDRPIAKRMPPERHDQIVKYARLRNPFNHMTVAYRRQSVIAAGGYPNIYLREDYGLWALMIMDGARCHNLQTVLVRARTGKGMYVRRGGVRYSTGEIELQKHLVRCGLKRPADAVRDAMSRSLVFLAPPGIRRHFYLRALRKKA